MRWVTYQPEVDGRDRVGLAENGAVLGASDRGSLIDLLASHDGTLSDVAAAIRAAPAEVVPERSARLRAPIPVPPSIRDFMAFEEHVVTSTAALGGQVDPVWYEIPVFYFTNPAAVHGPHDPVRISPGSSAFDYELEVAAVIGKPGSDIAVSDAARHIAGYMIMCDWSARDLQEREMRQGLGPAKGKDSATSLGPYLVTPDELSGRRAGNGYRLAMRASVNGALYSAGNLADLHWSFEQLVSYASRGTHLVPGDVIGSGTVGTGCILELSRVHGQDSYPWLEPGDQVRLTVDLLGAMQAHVTEGAATLPLR